MERVDEAYAIRRYQQAAALLPLRWQRLCRQVPEEQQAEAEELRLRARADVDAAAAGRGGAGGTGSGLPGGDSNGAGAAVRRGDGLLPVCGGGYPEPGVSHGTGRLPHRRVRYGSAAGRGQHQSAGYLLRHHPHRTGSSRGLSTEVLPQLFREGSFCSTLLLAPPGLGKTTLLRDLIRGLSDGAEGVSPHRVAVVDERGEIAVMFQGIPQMALGSHTDVLDACPKALGIPILLRSANPQVIAVDEITVREDLMAMSAAANCGCGFWPPSMLLTGGSWGEGRCFPIC